MKRVLLLKRVAPAALATAAFLGLAIPARAHNLGVECRLGAKEVVVEAFYDDDTLAEGAGVKVTDAEGREVAAGKTDGKGRWSFPRPAPGHYRVLVDAGAGHRTTQKLAVAGSAAPPGGPATRVSDGPSRQDFTRFPLVKVAIGLGAIALFAVLFLLIRKPARQP